MNTIVVVGSIALIVTLVTTEATQAIVDTAEYCRTAPCTHREMVALPWAPDAPEHHNGESPPPTTQMVATSTLSAGSMLGGFIMVPPRF
jgi:hypothetical protein